MNGIKYIKEETKIWIQSAYWTMMNDVVSSNFRLDTDLKSVCLFRRFWLQISVIDYTDMIMAVNNITPEYC